MNPPPLPTDQKHEARLDYGRDADGLTRHEVQNLINFQMPIATPVTLLLTDASHLALDPRGAAIMRRFRQDLLDLQRQTQQEPSHHWQLCPADIEASVSC